MSTKLKVTQSTEIDHFSNNIDYDIEYTDKTKCIVEKCYNIADHHVSNVWIGHTDILFFCEKHDMKDLKYQTT